MTRKEEIRNAVLEVQKLYTKPYSIIKEFEQFGGLFNILIELTAPESAPVSIDVVKTLADIQVFLNPSMKLDENGNFVLMINGQQWVRKERGRAEGDLQE